MKPMVNELRELRIGIVPTRRQSFARPEAAEQKKDIIAEMRRLEKELNFKGIYIEDLNSEGLMMTYEEAFTVCKRMTEEKADALFLPHCNFGQEEAVARLAKDLNVPVLIWGPRDKEPVGLEWRPTDSQCGMFATTKVLQRYGVTFSYIENCGLEDPVFRREFAQFLAVADTVKAFRGMRVAVISNRPKEFLSVMVNEAELLEKFDIELVPAESTQIMDMVDRQLKENRAGQEELLKEMEDNCIDMSRLGDKKYTWAAVELALLEFAEIHRCTAMSCECWKLIRSRYGFAPCSVFGDINDHGLPCACENDIHAAILSAMMVAARRYESRSYVADLTIRHPQNDNAELLWHCGPFAKSLKDRAKEGYIIESGQAYYEINRGEHSIMRFDGLGGEYYLFSGKGRGVEGPVTNGNYIWLETDNWVHWEKKFIFGPYIHHVVGIPGDITAVMREACRYIGVHYDDADSDSFVYPLS